MAAPKYQWFKIRHALSRDSRVLAIASRLGHDPRFIAWYFGPNLPRDENVTKRDAGVTDPVTPRDGGVTRPALRLLVVGALVELWTVANSTTTDGFFPWIGLAELDDYTGVPGFGAALASVGWAEAHTDGVPGVSLPGFDKYNDPQMGSRRGSAMSGAERTARWRAELKRKEEEALRLAHMEPARDRDESVTTSNVTVTTEEIEKRGEEKKDNTPPNPPEGGLVSDQGKNIAAQGEKTNPVAAQPEPKVSDKPAPTPAEPKAKPAGKRADKSLKPADIPVPSELATPEFLERWSVWLTYLHVKHRGLCTAETVRLHLLDLLKHGPAVGIKMLNQAMASGWKKPFPLQEDRPQSPQQGGLPFGRPPAQESIRDKIARLARKREEERQALCNPA